MSNCYTENSTKLYTTQVEKSFNILILHEVVFMQLSECMEKFGFNIEAQTFI